MKVKKYQKEVMIEFVEIDGVSIQTRKLWDFFNAIHDANSFSGAQGIFLEWDVKEVLEKNDIALHSQGRGWYPGKKFEECCKLLGWEKEF